VSGARGAYGLHLIGLEDAEELLVPAAESWPRIEVSAKVGDVSPTRQWARRDGARLRLPSGGQVEVDWTRRTALFTLPRPVGAAELVHPYLATVAAVACHRDGREGFHAAAVTAGGGAWAIVGDKGAGKSSLLAVLALRGLPVVADDVVVLDDRGRALAGPRFIDLREGAARELGTGTSIGVVGARERFRMTAGPVSPATPLRGFVRLEWGDELALTPVGPARRLQELYPQRIARLEPADARPMLELSTLPMLELRRPRDWRGAGAAADLLLTAL
jgi:hypothetical protein